MKKDMYTLFDDFGDETVELEPVAAVSADRIIELTKNKIKEDDANMKVKKIKHIPLIAAAAAVLLSATVFAAYNLMSPSEVAKRAEDYKLAESFDKEDIKFDFEPQTCGGYVFRLLGIISGRNLSGFAEVNENKSYIIGSISKEDGTALTDYPDIMVTPLVSGFKPWEVNAFTLENSGRQDFIEGGVDYFIFECENIEIFADHTIYIAAYEGMAPSTAEFTTAEDGSISFNESYSGAGALFTVPIDRSKADPEAVKRFIENNDIMVHDDAEAKDFKITQTETEDGIHLLIEDK